MYQKGLGNILQYRLLRLGILLIPLPGGSQLYDAMVNLKQGDLVLLFGYSRLLTEVQILLSYSEKAGYQTILFTDLLAEEHLSNANLTLYSFRGEPNDYHSVATPLLLIDLLIMKASQSLGGGLEKDEETSEFERTIRRINSTIKYEEHNINNSLKTQKYLQPHNYDWR